MLYCSHMFTLATSQDLFFLALAIAVVFLTGFICWSLYEIGSLLHKMNLLVDDVKEKFESASQAVLSLKERIQSSTNIIKTFSSGWKVLSRMLRERSEVGVKSKRRKRRVEEEEDELEDEEDEE